MKNHEQTKKEFSVAEKKLTIYWLLLQKKGGFDYLTKKESTELNKYTQIVKTCEDINYKIPLPQTLQG